jgi:hypothetical protein
MSLTYGYDLKENDDILVPVRKSTDIMMEVVMPGAALVNHLPFRTEQSFLYHWQMRVTTIFLSTTHPIVASIVQV